MGLIVKQVPPSSQGQVAASSLRFRRLAVALTLSGACAMLLLTAPVQDDFWWQDAPRHALNGAFVLDFIRALPLHDPLGWAADYYIKYPALTIGFYPPLFYVVEALFFALFGVTHFVAQLSVAPFTFALGLGAYRIARLAMSRWQALGAALLLLGVPQMALWSRQVMLDIPLQAAVVWAMFCTAQYVLRSKPQYVYASMALFVAALNIKFNAVFIAVPIATTLLVARGWRVLLDRHFLIAFGVGAVASIPVLLLTVRFGGVNVENVAGPSGGMGGGSPSWLFYLEALPAQIGLVPLALAVAGLASIIVRPPPLPRPMLVLLGTWFGFGYVVFSAIHVQEYRHDLPILFPLLMCAIYALSRWLPARLADGSALALGGLTLAISVFMSPPPRVSGYQAVTDFVAGHAHPGAVVVYSGYRDGNFVFGMRTHPKRGDIRILRTDKLLLRLAVTRNWGVKEMGVDEAGVLEMLKQDGVSLIVAQRGFWDDIPQMWRVNHVLDGPEFHRIASFPITGDLSTNDGRDMPGEQVIDVFEPTYEIPPPPASIDIDVPFGRIRLHGTLSK